MRHSKPKAALFGYSSAQNVPFLNSSDKSFFSLNVNNEWLLETSALIMLTLSYFWFKI